MKEDDGSLEWGAYRWWARVITLAVLLGLGVLPSRRAVGTGADSSGYSLRFYGHGVDGIDRVIIPIDPHCPLKR